MNGAEASEEPFCAGATRYHMPDAVELGDNPEGTLPAEIGSGKAEVDVPDTIYLPLVVDPSSDSNNIAGSRLAQTDLYVGTIAVERQSGTVSLNDTKISSDADTDACLKEKKN